MAAGNTPNPLYKYLCWGFFAGIIAALAAGAVGVNGGYNVAADDPHSAAILWLANTTRMNSISARAKGLVLPPNFGNEEQIKKGAGLYGEAPESSG